jgi:hypothetical protein
LYLVLCSKPIIRIKAYFLRSLSDHLLFPSNNFSKFYYFCGFDRNYYRIVFQSSKCLFVILDFIITNFANGDMVGHTGNFVATIKAVEALDIALYKVISEMQNMGGEVLIIADHGNCETMINPDGSPNTAHTTNPVPIILVDPELQHINNGVLGDIAPTILALLGIEKPVVMSCKSLL